VRIRVKCHQNTETARKNDSVNKKKGLLICLMYTKIACFEKESILVNGLRIQCPWTIFFYEPRYYTEKAK